VTRSYSSVCINKWFRPVASLAEMRREGLAEVAVGLHLGGESLGTAELHIFGKGNLHTESVHLRNQFRKKGHGLPFYKELIFWARKLGARRLYSSVYLNRRSRRMWRDKLPRAGFIVKEAQFSSTCYRCKAKSKQTRYYIELCPTST